MTDNWWDGYVDEHELAIIDEFTVIDPVKTGKTIVDLPIDVPIVETVKEAVKLQVTLQVQEPESTPAQREYEELIQMLLENREPVKVEAIHEEVVAPVKVEEFTAPQRTDPQVAEKLATRPLTPKKPLNICGIVH